MRQIGMLVSVTIVLFTAAVHAADLAARYDVVVAGAGTGGCAAAIQAARLGATVLLVEDTDWVGGQATGAAVSSMDEGHPDRRAIRRRGFYGEFVRHIEAVYKPLGLSTDTCYSKGSLGFEPRVGRQVLLDMIHATPGLTLSLRTTVTAVKKEGDRVVGVELTCVAPKSTEQKAVGCTVLIDATEFGDVLPLTGALYRVGNRTSDDPARLKVNPPVQDNTWSAVIRKYPAGVPKELTLPAAPPNYATVRARFERSLLKEGQKPDPAKYHWNWDRFVRYRGMPDSALKTRAFNGGPLPTRTALNFGNDSGFTLLDVEDPAHRADAECRAIERTLGLLYYIQTQIHPDWGIADDEGFDTPFNIARVDRLIAAHPELAPFRAVLVRMPVRIYARESRRIVGVYTLTSKDLLRDHGHTPHRFDSAIALGDYAVDVHGSHRPDVMERDLDPDKLIPRKWGQGGMGPFQVPMECLILAKTDGLLAAEKNISQSRLANGATRLQPSTMLTGQAAGALAALAIKHHVQPRDLPAALVQEELLKAKDPLTLSRFDDLPRDSDLWRAAQLAVTHQLLHASGKKFDPDAKLSEDDMKLLRDHHLTVRTTTRGKAAAELAGLILSHARTRLAKVPGAR